MIKKLLLLILVLLVPLSIMIVSQARQLRPKATPMVLSITPLPENGAFKDSSGNVVIWGYNSSTNFPALIKMDPSGNVLWAKEYAGLSSVIPIKALEQGSNILLIGQAGTSLYMLRVSSSNGSPVGNASIATFSTCSPLLLYSAITDGTNAYIAGQCGGDSLLIKVNSVLTVDWAYTYNLNSSSSADSFRDLMFEGSNLLIVGHGDFSGNLDLTLVKVDPANPLSILLANRYNIGSFDIPYALTQAGGNYYITLGNGGILKLDSSYNPVSAYNYTGASFTGMTLSGSSLLVWGSISPSALFALIDPATLSPVSAYVYQASQNPEYATSAFPLGTGHFLLWQGSAYAGFADSGLLVSGFSGASPANLTAASQTVSSSSIPLLNVGSNAPTMSSTPATANNYTGTITTIYTYTPPSGGGGGGPVIIPPPPPPETTPPPPPPPPENTAEVPAITIEGVTVNIKAEVPPQEAKITSAGSVPPQACPTPSVFQPVYGGVNFTLEPAGNTLGTGSLKAMQNGRFYTTLTLTYPSVLDKNAKVFACTNSGCLDITNLATIEGNQLRVKVEDGSVLDADGQVNGQVKTKNITYAVVPESYRKGGGCSMGGGADFGLLGVLAMPLMLLLRRLRLYAFLLFIALSLPAYSQSLQEYIREGAYEEALELVEKEIKERGLSEERAIIKADLLLKTGQEKRAVEFLKEALQFIPADSIRVKLAYAQVVAGDIRGAAETIKTIKKKGSDYYFIKGFMHFREGALTKAKYELSKVGRDSAYYEEAKLLLAQIYAGEKDSYRLKEATSQISQGSEHYSTTQSLLKGYEQRKRWSFNLSAGVERDTNLLGVFDLETKIRTWKYFINLGAGYEGDNLFLKARAYQAFNQKGRDYNLGYYSLSVEPVYKSLSFPVGFDYITLGGDFYASILQASLAYRSPFGIFYVGGGYQDYLSQPFDFENRDGYFLTAGHRYRYVEGRLYLSSELSGRYTDAKGKNWDSLSGGVRFFANYNLTQSLNAGFNAELQAYSYTKKNQAFLKDRRDLFVSLTPFVALNLYRNLSLVGSYTYMRNLSSINYYSYRRNLYTVQLSLKF